MRKISILKASADSSGTAGASIGVDSDQAFELGVELFYALIAFLQLPARCRSRVGFELW